MIILIHSDTQYFRTELGMKMGWQSANPDGEIRARLIEINGVELSTDDNGNGNAKATTVIAPGYENYKLCGNGDGGTPWEFGDALAPSRIHLC